MAGVVGRRFWSTEEKRAIVAESLEGGASIAGAARRHGMNANLIGNWRKDPRFNPALAKPVSAEPEPAFLPVEIDEEADTLLEVPEPVRASTSPTAPLPPSPVEIVLVCGTRLRIRSDVDEAALTRVIRAIGRAA